MVIYSRGGGDKMKRVAEYKDGEKQMFPKLKHRK